MASSFFIIFSLLLTLTTTISTSAVNTTTDQPSPLKQQQLNSIIDAIIGAGDFNNWADLLGKADPSIIPLTVTFFIPDDDAFLSTNSDGSSSSPSLDPRLFTYHVIPRRFSFSQLRQFPTGARLPTLLPEYTLLITNNSADNFTVNNAVITHPDLFQNAVVSVHGISSVLDYTLFGNSSVSDQVAEVDPVVEPEEEPSTTTMQVGPNTVSNEGSRGSRLHLNFILGLAMITFALFVLESVGFDLVIQNKAIIDVSECQRAAANSQSFIRFSSCSCYNMSTVESGLGLYLVMVLICATYAYIRGYHGPFGGDD